METRSRSGALLTELIIVVLIFTLCASVLIQLFYFSVGLGNKAAARDAALNAAQNTAEQLNASVAPEETLLGLGFVGADGKYVLQADTYRLEASLEEEPREAGTMLVYTVSGLREEEVLFTLPGKSYRGGEDA